MQITTYHAIKGVGWNPLACLSSSHTSQGWKKDDPLPLFFALHTRGGKECNEIGASDEELDKQNVQKHKKRKKK